MGNPKVYMELLHFTRLAKMPGDQVARINAKIQEDREEEEVLKKEAHLIHRTTQVALRLIENRSFE